jgi:murein DD-endopeptidase MepM/ murein hydrolase activator NlpD
MTSSRRASPLLTAVAVACALLAGIAGAPAGADPEEDLQAAQRRVNQAAAEYAEAQEQIALAEDEVARFQARVSQLETRVGSAREHVRQLALHLYVDGTAGITRLLRMADANDLVRAQQYSRVAAGASTDALGRYRAEREDLRDGLAALERKRASQAVAVENLRERQAGAMAEVDRLGRIAAQARAAQEAERQAQAAFRSQAQARAPSQAQSSSNVTSAGASAAGGLPSFAATPAAPAAPSTTAASAPVASGGWVCPVQGPHAFSNDYGAARGGGSSHQGNDILAARGTPVVANVDGVVRPRNGAVSGLSYFLDGDDGITYFGAHLDSFGASGRVTAGTVIGTVGNTGDAAGGPPHLHFEMHPGGWGNPVNPYSTLTRYC